MPYKLVAITNNEPFSYFVEGAAEVHYPINEWVEAPEWLAKAGYHLLYFDSQLDAQAYYRRQCFEDFPDYQIWEAEVKGEINPIPPRLHNGYLHDGEIVPLYCDAPWPNGTRMAKQIKLLRKVDNGR